MFPPRTGEAQSGGYLYIILDSAARGAVANQLNPTRIWGGVVWAAATGLLVVLLVGALAVRLLTRPLGRLAADMALFDLNRPEERLAAEANVRRDDEVAMLRASFDAMARRIGEQHDAQQRQSTAIAR